MLCKQLLLTLVGCSLDHLHEGLPLADAKVDQYSIWGVYWPLLEYVEFMVTIVCGGSVL